MYPTYPSLSFISLSSLTLYIETAMTLEGEAKMGLILKTELAISSQFSTFPATTISLMVVSVTSSSVLPLRYFSDPGRSRQPYWPCTRLTFPRGWYCDVQVACRPSAVSRLEMSVDNIPQ